MRINNYVYPNKLVNLEGIDKWLGTENHEEIGNMNRLITNKDIKSVTISLPTNKIPGPDGIPLWIKELIWILLKLYHKIEAGVILSNSFWNAVIVLLKTSKDTTRKENYMLITLRNISANIVSRIVAIWIKQYIESIIHHDQVGFIPRYKNGTTSTSPSLCKNHMIISIRAGKKLTKFNIHPR